MENGTQRIIGSYEGGGGETLLICFGAMHGNEPAGLRAIELVLKMLEIEPYKNKNFQFNGKLVGLIGNVQALNLGQRFIEKDLNRKFIAEEISILRQKPKEELVNEDRELIELLDAINDEIKSYKPSRIAFLDLHTTSSYGGIFTICRREKEAIRIATGLHAPIVLGMLDGLRGTTLHYFTTDVMGIDTVALTFESGQHEERLSVNRAIAGIISMMREIDMIRPDDVENYHEEILIEFSDNLPKLTTLVERYEILEGEGFCMKPGYRNFQTVEKGECIARNAKGKIMLKEGGRVLMPLYQDKGEDGFFIIKDISDAYGI